MICSTLYVFSKSEEMKASISRYIYYVGKLRGLKHAFDPQKNAKTFSFLEEITSVLDKEKPEALLNAAVILDISSKDSEANIENSWNPIQIDASITDIGSTLVLMYPEVYWIFIGMENNIPSSDLTWLDEHFINSLGEKGFERCIDLLSNHQDGYCPLFDPSGLRVWVKKNIEKEQEKPANDLEKGMDLQLAAAIDDETSYAFLHGYLANKLGYRSYAVTTLSMMEKLFKDNGKTFDLVFEDIFTSFPDKDTNFHLSDIKKKDDEFEGFKDVKKRIFVTVGHRHIAWYKNNEEYISVLKKEGIHVKTIYKPSGGVYNLLEKAGLFEDYWAKEKRQWTSAIPRIEKKDGHSTFGKILLISEKLIDRAEKIYYETKTVKDCIHGATLALDARNLIGYKTPTACLEAIALRHKLEVKAECMFYGVEYNIDVRNRFKEIEGEINTVSVWFHPKVKKSSSLNARMSVVTEIMRIFKDYGQFDEEQECLVCLRKLNRKWYFLRHPQLKFLLPLRWYIETLVGSFRYFVIAILFWPLFLGILSQLIKANFGDKSLKFSQHIVNSISIFFGIQPVEFPQDTGAMLITVILIFGGFLHLGIFISHLYTLITRGK